MQSTAALTAYDPGTGRVRWDWTWKFPGQPLRTVGSPICGQDMLFANAGDGGGDRHTVALKTTADGPPLLAWEKSKGLPYVPSMLAHDGHVYYVNDSGVAGCLSARTGDTVWTERLGGRVFASPILINGNVYAAMEDGQVVVFAAEPAFRLLARNQIGESISATPAVADGRLFVRGKNHLFCIAKAANSKRA